MVPALHDGDVLLARRARRGRGLAGRLVLARYRAMPGLLVVKRAVHPVDGGWWLASDNPFAGGDSSVHGVADVEAVVVLRLQGPGPRRPR